MLKRLIILVILLVMIKPAYDLSKQIWDEIVNWLDINSAITTMENINISEIGKTAKETIYETASTISALQATVHLPEKVQSVEELADAFFYHFSHWETNFEIHYVGSTSDIEHIIQQAVEEASNRDHYILGHLSDRKIEYEYGKYKAKIKVQQQYLTNAVHEQYVDERIAAILASVDVNSMSDFEKVKFVNDYIVKNTVYSTDTSLSPHSACAVLKENKGVCQGYALLALKMLRDLGIETLYVVGEVHTGPHAWNLVKVDGEWYHLDTTWNDPVPDRGNAVRYQYFLLDDATMKLDHRWNEADYPKAISKKYTVMSKIDHAYEKDGYIYYSNIADDHRLYRLNLSTGENKRLTKSRAQYIVGLGEWIFFSNYSKGAYLARIRTDGSDESIIYREKVSDLLVEDGYLIFATDEGLKKMEIRNS
ncbi:transglutaminase domain-containing protein [Ureibacillus sp. FSL W8-0352]|uniref:transglutaminase domain-containing protein n=1 Tax=Ureibacillus sp. FSL W8-0352 TaxID=2954596 RepID=UPI0030FCCF9D